MGALALGLWILTVTGVVRLWEVYLFAFLLGCAAAFDSPARQSFVAELVGEANLANAVALNSTSFNIARTIGPRGGGPPHRSGRYRMGVPDQAASFVAVLCSLGLLRRRRIAPRRRQAGQDPRQPRRRLPLCVGTPPT